MKYIYLLSILILGLISCETSYDSSKEVSINIEIEGDDINGEVRLQRVNSDYSIELVQSANFIENKINYVTIQSRNGSIITKLICLIYLLDYASIYAAICSETDPTPVKPINYFKNLKI